MARSTRTVYIDDLTGKELDSTELVEVHFAHNGQEWVLDTNEKDAAKLAALLEPYKAAGSKVGRATATSSKRKSRSSTGNKNAAIREWAKANGHAVSERGRVSSDLIAAYEKVHA